MPLYQKQAHQPANTTSLNCHGPDDHPNTQPTVSEHQKIQRKNIVEANLKEGCLVVAVSMLVDNERHLMMKTQQMIDTVT